VYSVEKSSKHQRDEPQQKTNESKEMKVRKENSLKWFHILMGLKKKKYATRD
jgi:hypothetical protein